MIPLIQLHDIDKSVGHDVAAMRVLVRHVDMAIRPDKRSTRVKQGTSSRPERYQMKWTKRLKSRSRKLWLESLRLDTFPAIQSGWACEQNSCSERWRQ